MTGLVLKEVSKSFDGQEILKGINLTLGQGELLVVLGPSGCGKSTLLRLIAGLEELDQGEIWHNDRRLDQLPPAQRDVAMVFQNYSLYPHMTVFGNLAFPLKAARTPRAEIKGRVAKAAELLGLGDHLEKRPGQLSGGQRQRVALGRAIVRQPQLFLLDEPLSNLDAELRQRMRREIVSLQKRVGVTTVHVTHDQAEALTMADQVALVNEGRLVQVGCAKELYRRPHSLFAARFVGQPQINLIALNRAGELGHTLRNLLPAELLKCSLAMVVGLRPESLRLDPNGQLAGTVVATEYFGDEYVATVDISGQEIVVSGLPEELPKGDQIRLEIDLASLLVFEESSEKRVYP